MKVRKRVRRMKRTPHVQHHGDKKEEYEEECLVPSPTRW